MEFKDPRVELPEDGQRVQFKVTGDPLITGVEEPTIGVFEAPTPNFTHSPGFLGGFRDEKTGKAHHVWTQNEHEVAAWRDISLLLQEA